MPQWFDLDAEEGPISDEFERMQYESKNYLMNSGTIFIIEFILFVLIMLSLLMYGIRKASKST